MMTRNWTIALAAGLMVLLAGSVLFFHQASHHTATTISPSSSPSAAVSASGAPSPSPAATAKRPAPQRTPAPTPRPTSSAAVTIVALSAHVETQVGYELDASIGSDLASSGVCKLTMTKPGSQPVVMTQATQPDPAKANGYTTYCHIIHLLATWNGHSWDYYVEPGTWTITVQVSNGTAGGTATSTLQIYQMNMTGPSY